MKKPGKRQKRAFVHLRRASQAEVFPLKPDGRPPIDTPKQKKVLVSSSDARAVRWKFPNGCRVATAVGQQGVVERHVPQPHGGYLVVRWDGGDVEKVLPTAVFRLREEQ